MTCDNCNCDDVFVMEPKGDEECCKTFDFAGHQVIIFPKGNVVSSVEYEDGKAEIFMYMSDESWAEIILEARDQGMSVNAFIVDSIKKLLKERNEDKGSGI